MSKVTTTRILAYKALQVPCGRECVDWAISKLEEGKSGHHLAMLAGMVAPFNHFEMADLRDRAMRELGVPERSDVLAVEAYAAERLRRALAGEDDLGDALRVVKDLCVAQGMCRELRDFYLLYFAHSDLQEYGTQRYWPGATRENILSIIAQRSAELVARYPPDLGCAARDPETPARSR
jgi:hypothetical protein